MLSVCSSCSVGFGNKLSSVRWMSSGGIEARLTPSLCSSASAAVYSPRCRFRMSDIPFPESSWGSSRFVVKLILDDSVETCAVP